MRRKRTTKCRECGTLHEVGDNFPGGVCPSCLDQSRKERRARTGSRLLARADEAGSEQRDGQTFRVVVLPPTRRARR